MEEDTEYEYKKSLKLPIEERCVHKLWKSRLNGYEEAAKLFRQLDDDKSPEWGKYIGLLKKFVADSNAPAQEKGLEAVLAFVENYGSAGKTATEVTAGLVQKCVGATKAKTKDLAAQVALMYIEIEKQEAVIDELLKGIESKNPKTSCGCLNILTQALREFGAKVISVGKILKKMPILLSDRDQNVRAESKLLIIEIYRWIGPAIKQPLSSLKPVQLTDLETEFEKVKPGISTPSRLLRSQQAKKAAQAGDACFEDQGSSTQSNEGDGECEIDPTEFLEPVDVLSKLPKDFYAQLEAKKWTDRRDALESFEKELSAAPRLETGDYGDLIRALKKVIAKDSNVVVIALALKCLAGLASGLKKKFTPYVGGIMPTILEKFKEKKQNVVQALREVVDAIFLTSHLEQLSEDIIAALDNKNPGVKTETALFLSRCFCRCTPATLNKKLLKLFVVALLKTLNDSDVAVREGAAVALGTAMKVVGEKAIGPFLGDIGEAKTAKIKSCYEKVELLEPIKVAKTEIQEVSSSSSKSSVKPVTKPQSKIQKGVKRPLGSATRSVKSSNSATSELHEKITSQIPAGLVPADILFGITAEDDDQRLKANEDFLKQIKEKTVTSHVSSYLLILMFGSGMDDQNSKTVTTKLESLKRIAENCDLSDCDISNVLIALVKKLSESEYVDSVSSCLAAIAKSAGCDEVAQIILGPPIIRNNQYWTSALNWISEGIINYNLNFSEEYLQSEAKRALSSGNQSVRNSGLALIGSLHMIKREENSNEVAPQKPSRLSSAKKKEVTKTNDVNTPLDIMTIVTPPIISNLSDDNWKTRHDTILQIQSSISNNSISSNLGEFSAIIEDLLVDKNSKVVVNCLSLLSTLAKAIGPQCRQYSRSLVPKILKNLADTKIWVRQAVISTLNTWGSTGGYKEFFDNDNIADTIKMLVLPVSKIELWNWLSSILPTIQTVPKDGLIACLPHLYLCIEDRNAEVRKAANEAVVHFMLHLGYDSMLAATDNFKGSCTQIKLILEKNRGSVPEILDIPSKNAIAGPNKNKFGPGSSATYTKPNKTGSSLNNARISVQKRKDDDLDSTGPLLEINTLKHQRVLDEQKLRTLKWNFVTPRSEFIELLKDQMTTANFNSILISHMFHADFRYHIKAIDSLSEDLLVNREALMCNLDLILRWMTIRFFDTNPSVLLKGLEYLNNVFNCLVEDGCNLLDNEASAFLPYLLIKAGDPKDTVRNQVKNIFRLISSLYPRTKMFSFLMEGLKSKNSRQRSEILEHLSWLIENFTLNACCNNPVIALKEIARHIGDRDRDVRNAALNCMVAVYFLEGERMYKIIGQLSQKDLSMLEERIKRACKNRPIASVKPIQSEPVAPLPSEIPSMTSPRNERNQQTFSMEEEAEDGTEIMPEPRDITIRETSQVSSVPRGPFSLDSFIDEFETCPVRIQPPDTQKVDLQFLKDPPKMPELAAIQSLNVSSISIPSNSTTAIKWELNQICSSDPEKAIHALTQLENILITDKAHVLRPYLDFMVEQLVLQLISLNQSTHPDLVNCYRTNFSLIMKLCDNKILCQDISEQNLQKLIKQLLLLLTEHRLKSMEQGMFIKVVNNVVIRLLDSANKTSVMCALIKMLCETINPTEDKHFQDLVMKCLWKSHRTQPAWDAELNYPKILTDINYFLQEYPSAWWKTQESDVPLRSIKTILHSMVKIRGVYVKECLRQVPAVSSDSEMSVYIRKVIRHLQLEESNHDSNYDKTRCHEQEVPQRIAKE